MKKSEDEKRYNVMGSEVAEGYRCKPVKKDPGRPIMYFKHHILLCTGERCRGAAGSRDIADEMRGELEDLNLHRGRDRIKVTRANCFGACRFRSVAVIYENGTDPVNNCIWIKQIHRFDARSRQTLFESLKKGEPIAQGIAEDFIIPMDEPEDC